MWPFKRKKPNVTTTKVPAEVQDYYEAGRRERKGIAWLLGIVTLIITILLALLLFFGGRWVYRKATKKETTNQPATTQQAPANTPTSQPSQPTGDQNSGSQNAGSSTSPASSGAASDTGNTAPLPRTGPDLDL